MRNWNERYTRYLNRQCSPEDVRALLEHFQLEGEVPELRERIEKEFHNQAIPDADAPEVTATFQRIQQRLAAHTSATDTPIGGIRRFGWLGYAASLLAAFTLGWLIFELSTKPAEPTLISAADITPGGNRATLTLGNGTTVDLSSEQSGIVIGDRISYLDGSAVVETEDRRPKTEVSPSGTEKGSPNANLYVLSTPKGGTYQITLPDGSKVWLNAASTLKYPGRFDEEERVVYLEGEAYFQIRNMKYEIRDDVADKNRIANLVSRQPDRQVGISKGNVPFRVIANGQTVEVLGTEFNISAYGDEAESRTTLVSGKVKVVTEHLGTLALEPGEQTSLKGNAFNKKAADVSSAIAWKSGLFSFDDTELATVMNQLARWFDLEVVYAEGITATYYYGAISRQEHLGKVLDLLRESGLNFKVERINNTNRLTVLP